MNLNKYEFKYFRNIQWLKIMFQDMADLKGFDNIDEAKSCNQPHKYSIISEIDDSFKLRNKKFEFLLEYPELNLYNIWFQENSPLNEEEYGQKEVRGYKPVHIGAYNPRWGGLARSDEIASKYCLINGVPSVLNLTNWLYGIGVITGAGWSTNGVLTHKIPAHNTGVNIYYLWVRFPLLPDFTIFCRCSPFHHHSLFIFICLYES